MFLCDFLCGFLLARPLIFKSGPGTCNFSYYSKIYFLKHNTCQGERNKNYDSGGSNPATSERIRLAVCLLPAGSWFCSHTY